MKCFFTPSWGEVGDKKAHTHSSKNNIHPEKYGKADEEKNRSNRKCQNLILFGKAADNPVEDESNPCTHNNGHTDFPDQIQKAGTKTMTASGTHKDSHNAGGDSKEEKRHSIIHSNYAQNNCC